MTERKLQNAEQIAEKLVRDEGLTLPINVLALAASREIHVEAKPASAKGVSGMLIRAGESYAIAYATHITSEGFQRFSIAHELGHLVLFLVYENDSKPYCEHDVGRKAQWDEIVKKCLNFHKNLFSLQMSFIF